MRLTELAARMPLPLRKQLESEAAYAPWIARGVPLLRLLTDPAVLETVWNRMSQIERRVLHLVIVHMGCEPFDEGKLEKPAEPYLAGAELRIGFTGLLRLGIVYAFRKSWGEQVYVFPEEALAAWQRLFAPVPPPGGHSPGDAGEAAEPYGYSNQTDLGIELFHALVYAARQDLKLTKSGTLHKKHIQKLTELNRLDEERLGGAAIKFAFADAYPLKLAVVLDCILRLELAVQTQEEWVLQPEALSRWLNLNAAEQNRRLYAVWRSLTLPPASWQQHALIMLERHSADEPCSAADLLSKLTLSGFLPPAVNPEERKECIQSLERQCLKPLSAMGWLDRDGQGGYTWRLPLETEEKEGEEEGAFIVQPDFEILVPPDVPRAVCWELSCLADLFSLDQMSIYKLTKDTLKRALENGRTAEEIEAFLVRHSLYELPDNVLITLRQWMKPFGQTAFREVTLLRLADAETARSIAKLPGAAAYLTEPVGERDYIVAQTSVQPLFEALERAGYMAWRPIPDGSAAITAYPKLMPPDNEKPAAAAGGAPLRMSCAEQGLIYSRHSVAYFEMEGSLPEVSRLYPEMNDIPGSWLRDYRTYHPSTRKEMIEQAIRMRTLLMIRKGGKDYLVAPRKLQESRGSWCMTGWEQSSAVDDFSGLGAGAMDEMFSRVSEIRWLADEWQEMKLILPGINDR